MRDTTISRWCAKHFQPYREHNGRSRGRTRGPHWHVTAISRFSKYLEHEARLSDLTVATLDGFRDWLAAQTLTVEYRRATISRLRGIFRAAVKQGATDEPLPRTWRRRISYAWESGSPPPTRDEVKTVVDFFGFWYLPLRLAGRSHNTVRLYDCTIRTFGRYLGREPLLSDLCDDTLGRFIAWRLSDAASRHTAVKDRDQLLAIANYAAKKRFIVEFVEVARPTAPKRVPRAWMRPDLDRLWRALGNVEGRIAGIPAADWWLALHHVLWASGERISAVLQLRWDDVDLDDGWLTVRAEYRKGRLADKLFKLSPDDAAALTRIREPEWDNVFPWNEHPSTLWKRYTTILRTAGLANDSRSKFHRMRRSVASHYEAVHPGAATALLGHSGRKVTEAYLDPRLVKIAQPADVLFVPGASEPEGGAA